MWTCLFFRLVQTHILWHRPSWVFQHLFCTRVAKPKRSIPGVAYITCEESVLLTSIQFGVHYNLMAFSAGLIFSPLVPKLYWCLLDAGAELCISPHWTWGGFCWPRLQVSQNLSGLKLHCSTVNPCPCP